MSQRAVPQFFRRIILRLKDFQDFMDQQASNETPVREPLFLDVVIYSFLLVIIYKWYLLSVVIFGHGHIYNFSTPASIAFIAINIFINAIIFYGLMERKSWALPWFFLACTQSLSSANTSSGAASFWIQLFYSFFMIVYMVQPGVRKVFLKKPS